MKDIAWWEKWVRGSKALPESVSLWIDFGGLVPVQSDGSPRDRELFETVYAFAGMVQAGERKAALKLLRLINKRKEVLVKEQEARAVAFLKLLGYDFR